MGMNWKSDHTFLSLDLAGQESKLAIPPAEIESLHRPILSRMSASALEKGGRFIVFLAGPPGAGKSTAAGIWEKLAERYDEFVQMQVLPMDGFHLPNKVLQAQTIVIDGQTVPLETVKGAPESYDLSQFSRKFKAVHVGRPVCWPLYDRRLHDPLPDALEVRNEGILIVEGNYLLLNEQGWCELKDYADFTIFMNLPEEVLKNDIVERHIKGGRSIEDALGHYEFNDRRNWKRVMNGSMPANITLTVRPGRKLGFKPTNNSV